MASITYWTRLEPRPRSKDFARGLAAEIADPLWFLSRQWQMGEYIGDDSGSIAHVEAKWSSTKVSKLASYSNANGSAARSSATVQNVLLLETNLPMEMLVEREKIGPSLKLRVQLGQNFERMLRKAGLNNYIDMFRSVYSLDPPQQATEEKAIQTYFNFMKDRVMDGYKLKQELDTALATEPAELPSSITVSQNDREAILSVAQGFHRWFNSVYTEPAQSEVEQNSDCWMKDRLEYKFAASAPSFDEEGKEIVLAAPEYSEGSLDWYSFSLDNQSSSLGNESNSGTGIDKQVAAFLPANVTFKGMPNKRWWDFEDETVNFGAIDADKRDIAKLIVMDFALVSGNDWFIIPLSVDVGSLTRVESLIVTDVFGERFLIRSADEPSMRGTAGDRGWSIFKLSTALQAASSSPSSRTSDFLYLPPTLGFLQEGPEIEKVNFIRDEMANMVWAIEQLYENELGDAASGYELNIASQQNTISSMSARMEQAATKLKYILQTNVPRNWIPFLPVHVPGSIRAVDLQLAEMVERTEEGESRAITVIEPKTDLLHQEENEIYRIKEEEVPRAGIFVSRRYQRARWIDGNTYMWVGRRKSAGRGEGSSSLSFDVIEETKSV
jgi:hypothetical protein